MRSTTLIVFLACLLILVVQPGFAQTEVKPVITVLDFKTSGISRAEVEVFVDYLSSHIVETGRFTVIDRTQREALLDEIEFSASDCTEENCQLQIGRLLSANQIIVGSIGKVGERFLLTVKIIEVETGETLKTGSERYTTLEALIDDARHLAFTFAGKEAAGGRAGAAAASTRKTAGPPKTESGYRHSALVWGGHLQGEGYLEDILIGASYHFLLQDWLSLTGGVGFGLWEGTLSVTAGAAVAPLPFLFVGLRVGYCSVSYDGGFDDRVTGGSFCLNPTLLLRFGRMSIGGEFGWAEIGTTGMIWYGAGVGINL